MGQQPPWRNPGTGQIGVAAVIAQQLAERAYGSFPTGDRMEMGFDIVPQGGERAEADDGRV